MIKLDKMFFAACGVFAIGVVVAVMGYEFGLLFLVGAYLLRPTLHAFDLAGKTTGEREVGDFCCHGLLFDLDLKAADSQPVGEDAR